MKKKSKKRTPIVDGENATFVWRGPIAPVLVGDFNNWDANQAVVLENSKNPDVWKYTMKLPRDAYMEYIYVLNGERVYDPGNPRRVFNGRDAENNYFYMPEGAPTPLAKRKKDIPRGQVTRHVLYSDWMLVGGKRKVHLYQPLTTEPCPLLVVFDGNDYRRRARLVKIVDNLIAQQRIRPLALAMVANAGQAREVEYACSEATIWFLAHSLLPLAQEKLNLIDIRSQPGAYGVMGASMGGLISLFTAMRLPEIFGYVLSQSGGFDENSVLTDLIRLSDPFPLKIWMDVGVFDFLYEQNKQMHALLASKGYDVTYAEYNGGHNYAAWRDDVWRGLEALFGVDQRTSSGS